MPNIIQHHISVCQAPNPRTASYSTSMNEEFKKILNRVDIEEVDVPHKLAENIILKIDVKARQHAKIKTLGLSTVSALSVIASIPIISQIITSLHNLDFIITFQLFFQIPMLQLCIGRKY